ncbi:unnamed protein product [Schistosoma turkestanicum]|nr:unnamed protein product [Schistosoma turkestanicum]
MYTKIDVNCKLPICHSSNKLLVKQSPTALASDIQQFINSGSGELRSLLRKNYPKMKIPVFQFFITEEAYKVTAPLNESNDVVVCATTTTPTFIKPNNVYGLERNKLVNIINTRLKAMKKKSHQSESKNLISDNYEEVNISPEYSHQARTSTAAWAKYWKERQDWRAVAKRERRLRYQSLGLQFLTLSLEKSNDREDI